MRIRLDFPYASDYEFEIQGRDTYEFWDRCTMQHDLGPNPESISLNISEYGRPSSVVIRSTHWAQLADVRPPAKASRIGALSRMPKRLQH